MTLGEIEEKQKLETRNSAEMGAFVISATENQSHAKLPIFSLP